MKHLLFAAALFAASAPTFALNILVTNDDGFETANVQALYRALVRAGHDVILSAPYVGQSGTGGQIAFLQPIPPTQTPSEGGLLPAGSDGVGPTTIGAQQFYVDGSPAAAVLYGIDVKAPEIWGARPDLVISGPNEGNNLGVITPHSGTLGAAVTALNKGIPAVAVSAENGNADEAEIVAELVVKLVTALDGRAGIRLPQGIGLNVNLPPIDPQTQIADAFDFFLTRLGSSANFGLQFFDNLGDSPIAQASGIPADIGLPGVSVTIPPEAAGYPLDDSNRSETNALDALVVTVSPIQGTYAVNRATEREVAFRLRALFRGQ
jgi:5'-nucleotidase